MKLIYIYAILDDDDNVIYVGESVSPRGRLSSHHAYTGYKRCKILEIYESREHYWIDRLISEGNPLENKERLSDGGEKFCVGDIISLKGKPFPPQKLRHKITGEVYRSGYHAAKLLENIKFDCVYNMKHKPNHPYHDILEFIN